MVAGKVSTTITGRTVIGSYMKRSMFGQPNVGQTKCSAVGLSDSLKSILKHRFPLREVPLQKIANDVVASRSTATLFKILPSKEELMKAYPLTGRIKRVVDWNLDQECRTIDLIDL